MGRGKVVVVTGASAGVGRATVREFARRGASLGLVARGEDGLAAARRDVESLGGRALAVPADVSDAAAVEGAAAVVEEAFGPIDVWVNDAMVSVFSPVKQLLADEVRRVTEVTYLGYVHGTLAALRRMLPRDRGVIVQVGSALAYRAIPLQAAYCGAKHAIKGFTESLQVELRHDRSRVKVTIVDLPAHNTPQFGWVRSRLPRKPQPVPPIFQPEVAARAIVWAAEHPRRRISVGLPTVVAIYGNRLAPVVGDVYLARTGYASQQHDGAPPADRRDKPLRPDPRRRRRPRHLRHAGPASEPAGAAEPIPPRPGRPRRRLGRRGPLGGGQTRVIGRPLTRRRPVRGPSAPGWTSARRGPDHVCFNTMASMIFATRSHISVACSIFS